MYITFDPFYSVDQYNDFIKNAKKNDMKVEEYISIKPPHYWYVKVNKSQLPFFLRYKEATADTTRWLVEKLKPLYPNEEIILKRRPTDSLTDYEKFVSPKIFKKVRTASYACLFRYKNNEELMKITKEMPFKIYVLGKYRTWNLALCFNKYIRNYVFSSWVLIEKTKDNQFSKPGEFEQHLNYKILVSEKFDNKTIEYPFFKDGVLHPLKRLK